MTKSEVASPRSGRTIVTKYVYDGDGNRVAQDISYPDGGSTLDPIPAPTGTPTNVATNGQNGVRPISDQAQVTQFVVDINNPIPVVSLERNRQGNMLKRYIHDNTSTAPIGFVSQAATGTGTVTVGGGTGSTGAKENYYMPDLIGTTTMTADQSTGTPSWSYTYDPLGASVFTTWYSSNTIAQDQQYRFAGEYQDPNTGLYTLRARDYDPTTGRFQQTDPLGQFTPSGALNSYAYGRDDPVDWIDPAGLCANSPFSSRQASQNPCPAVAGLNANSYTSDPWAYTSSGVQSGGVEWDQYALTAPVAGQNAGNPAAYSGGAVPFSLDGKGLPVQCDIFCEATGFVKEAKDTAAYFNHEAARFWGTYGTRISMAAGLVAFAVCVIPVTAEACTAVSVGVATISAAGRISVYFDSNNAIFSLATASLAVQVAADYTLAYFVPSVPGAANKGAEAGEKAFVDSAAGKWLSGQSAREGERWWSRRAVGWWSSAMQGLKETSTNVARAAGAVKEGGKALVGQVTSLGRVIVCLPGKVANSHLCK